MVLVHATILGGLPIVADISSGKDADTPNGPGEYWMEVDAIFWRRADGSRGKEVSECIYERCDKYDSHWQADLTEQADDWLSAHCPVRWRDPSAPGGYRVEGEYSPDFILLNGPRPAQVDTHAKRGDANAAPSPMGSAVAEGDAPRPDGQTTPSETQE